MKTRSRKIRIAEACDASDVARIYVDSWNLGFGSLTPHRLVDAELITRWEKDLTAPLPHRWWIAEVDGLTAGFAGICPSRDPVVPGLGELDTIATTPSMWRRGIGSALMAMAVKSLARDGYREAVVWTLANYERGRAFTRRRVGSWTVVFAMTGARCDIAAALHPDFKPPAH